jgi:membrane protein
MKKDSEAGKIERLVSKVKGYADYCMEGVWSDPRVSRRTRFVKMLNLSVTSFMDRGLQSKSMSLTYSSVLAIVPAFALLVAIGRGFGLQDLLQSALYNGFPSQRQMIDTAMQFVDSYLSVTTQGVFVGIGLLFLLWTVISLLSQIEDVFNTIWGIKRKRALYQKITDYIAICLMIPVLLICSSGVSFLMSDFIQQNVDLPFLSQWLNVLLGCTPLILCWAAFTLSYYLIPNTKVKFKYAAISGAAIAIAFELLQLLFLNGQIYVSKYNAIYGSFAFLPLMLIWMQLSWLMLLTGCMLTYSLQNVFTYKLMGNIDKMSVNGWRNIALIIMSLTSRRFENGETPLSDTEIAVEYYLPIRTVTKVIDKLREANLLYDVQLAGNKSGVTPAIEITNFTVGEFFRRFDTVGDNDIVPNFKKIYMKLLRELKPATEMSYKAFDSMLLKDLPIPDRKSILNIIKEK